MTSSPISELVKNLFKTTNQVDVALNALQEKAAEINAKYEPRSEFIRWRDSQEGKLWKREQYEAQGKCCAICQKSIQLQGSHIDHIKPLSSSPHLTLDTRNMQITCPDCNIAKGNTSILSTNVSGL